MRYAASEIVAGGDGAASSLARLAELLFAEAIRGYVRTLPETGSGWLAGLRDPYVARALALIHARPTEPWTLEALAGAVGLSRSAFTDRFLRRIRMSPMRYLRRQRLQRAAERLRHGRLPVSRVALEAGYESEAAFTRAFKRELGVAPTAYRTAGPGT